MAKQLLACGSRVRGIHGVEFRGGFRSLDRLPVQRWAVTKRQTSAPAHIKRLRTIRNAALVCGWWEEVGALGEHTDGETQTDISIDIHTFTKCSSRGAILTKKI